MYAHTHTHISAYALYNDEGITVTRIIVSTDSGMKIKGFRILGLRAHAGAWGLGV